ncbi:MAG: hypothetical protein ABF289_11635 [Clostridiales bacterium]
MKKIVISVVIVVILIITGMITGLYFVGDKIVEEALLGDVDEMLDDEMLVDDSLDIDSEKDQQKKSKDKYTSDSENITTDDENSNQKSEAEKTQTSEKKNVISVDNMKKANENITKKEKVKVAATVVKRLSISEMSDLKGMAKGGLSNDEKSKAKDIIYNKFTEEEVENMKDLYLKSQK